MERRKTRARTAALIALAAAVSITTLALYADCALAQRGRGGYGRQAGPGLGRAARAGRRLAVAERRADRALVAVENARVRCLMTDLNLDRERGDFVRKAYERGLERKHRLLRERSELLLKMRDAVRPSRPATGPTSDATEQEMRDLILKYREVERELAKTAWDTEDKIFERLSPAQKLRYIILNERFDLNLRQRIGALRQRGLGPGLGSGLWPGPGLGPAPVPPSPPEDLPDDSGE